MLIFLRFESFFQPLKLTLAGATMGHELTALLLSDFDLGTGDDGTSEGCAKEICSVLDNG
jgi:hypothetical protein